ncbi:MAG: hypothetical protein WC236_00145 [Gallionellaceae bacterium]|jgi:hypothetical protein
MQTNKLPNIPPENQSTTDFFDWLYSLLLMLPVLGEIVLIVNAYVFDGDLQSGSKLAPASSWIRKLWGNVVVTAALAFFSTPYLWVGSLTTYVPAFLLADHRPIPGNLIISIFPSLLGFGIGVYALIFGLSSILIKGLQEHMVGNSKIVDQRGSALILNADMAYPLLILTLTLFVGVLQQIYPSSHKFEIAAWFALWYSLLMVIEILSVLFNLGEFELLNKLKSK